MSYVLWRSLHCTQLSFVRIFLRRSDAEVSWELDKTPFYAQMNLNLKFPVETFFSVACFLSGICSSAQKSTLSTITLIYARFLTINSTAWAFLSFVTWNEMSAFPAEEALPGHNGNMCFTSVSPEYTVRPQSLNHYFPNLAHPMLKWWHGWWNAVSSLMLYFSQADL